MKQEILTFYGNVQIPNGNISDPNLGGLSQFRINTRYVNNTRQPVRVQLRSGMEMVLPYADLRNPRVNDAQILIQHELVVGPTCVEEMRNYFMGLSADAAGALKLFAEVYQKVFDSVYQLGRNRELRCIIEYFIPEVALAQAGGIFYHDELDTVFKLGKDPFTQPHPHTGLARRLKNEQEAQHAQDQHGFIFWVEIIDNLGKYGERYLSICNEIYKISPRTDKNRPDGLYIVSSKPTNGKINSEGVITKFYAFDAIEKELGIYATFELANSHGDIAATRKRELAELEHNITLERQQFQREKIRFEAELEERNRKVKDLEWERATAARSMEELKGRTEHLLEMERIRTRDLYERRSNERKDTSEFIKFLPTILAAVGTLLMAYRTFKSGS